MLFQFSNKLWHFKVKESMHVFKKWKVSHTVLERPTLCFSSYKNRKLKVKLWLVGAGERKKRAFFVPFILSDRNCFNIWVLSQCIAHSIHFQNIHTYRYQQKLLHAPFCLFLKSLKTFSLPLSWNRLGSYILGKLVF